MTLKTQMAADASIFIDTDDFGEEITYNGAASTINAELVYGETVVEDEMGGQQLVKSMEAMIKKSDVTLPARNDTIENSDEEVFVVQRSIRSDAVFHIVEAVKVTRQTLGNIGR